MPDLTPENRTDSRQQWDSPSPSFSPTRGLADPNDDVATGSSKSTGDQASSDSGLSRGNLADSDLDTASGDCLSCLNTDEISVSMVHKKYRKRVRASCKLHKGVDWMDTQMKSIWGGHQDVWGHDHKIIRAKQKCALADDHTSFEMRWMATRIDQLIHKAKATGSKIYTRESEAEAQGSGKALVLPLKQFHAHYYRHYKKGTTRAMVDLQGLHLSDAFQCLNMLASMSLRSYCPWHLKFWGNTETIATHLREVHYRLAIACNICQSFASISVQVVLKHQSKCQAKLHKKSKIRKCKEASKSQNQWIWDGGRMPETFHPRQLLSMDPSSHLSHLVLHMTFQTIIFSVIWFVLWSMV